MYSECLVYIGQEVGEKNTSSDKSNVRQFMGIKAVHLLAAFALVYVGTEVTIGGELFRSACHVNVSLSKALVGWTVTYIIEERGGGPSAGYISSGFFGGLSLGRVALLWVNKKVRFLNLSLWSLLTSVSNSYRLENAASCISTPF